LHAMYSVRETQASIDAKPRWWCFALYCEWRAVHDPNANAM
jgi:hypothetical protein